MAKHTVVLRVINIDKNLAYGPVIKLVKQAGNLPDQTEHRKVKYLNNRIECAYRRIKRLIKYGIGFHSFKTGYKTIRGYEAMYIIRKEQTRNIRSYLDQVRIIEKLFELIA